MAKFSIILLLIIQLSERLEAQILGDEAIYTINTKKALHSVNEKFISLSIDPAVLLTGFNLSDASLELARHFGPAYIRIAGPSTQFVKYIDAEEHLLEDSANVIVTPSMWFGINEWLTLANLTPVFGINDIETTARGVWNPKSVMPLLEISDKFNVTCHWQLGYDCSNKTEMRYKEDLLIFRHILDAFPDKRDIWKIVGSDLTKCADNTHFDHLRRNLEEIQDFVAAVVWEPESDHHAEKIIMNYPIKPKIPFWIVAHKDSHPVSFSSALEWAQQIGEAAKNGYEAIFRELRLHEIFTETPAYWVSLLHKALMGRNVLDIKSTTPTINPQISLYAHCTKHQNNFIRSGAMTILMINNASVDNTVFLRFGSGSLKNAEVQSYILTAPDLESTDVYLNGNKLTLADFNREKINLVPKLRRARVLNYLSLSLPPKSIGFFVLPTARVPICISGEESEFKLLMEEIGEDQKIPFSQEVSIDLAPRFGIHNRGPTLKELQHLMEKELESDERYYSKMKTKKQPLRHHEQDKTHNNPSLKDARNFFIERAKLAEKQRKQLDNEHKRFNVLKEKHGVHHDEEKPVKELELELELTSAEIRRVLADRAKARAAKKNIIFTSAELEEIMNKATERFLKNRNTTIKLKRKSRDTLRDKKDINMRLLNLKTLGDRRKAFLQQIHQLAQKNIHEHAHRRDSKLKRERRDINFELLKLKTDLLANKNKKKATKTKFDNNETKIATIRAPDENSPEFNEESDEIITEDPLPKGDVYAEIAETDSNNNEEATEKSSKFSFKPNALFNLNKATHIKLDIPAKQKKINNNKKDEDLNILEFDNDESDPLDSLTLDESYPLIHEYFALSSSEGKKSKTPEKLEFGEIKSKRTKYKVVKNRGNIGDFSDDIKDDLDLAFETDYADLDSAFDAPVKLRKRAIADNGKFYYVIGKGYNKEDNFKIDENLKNLQYNYLKNRLAARKSNKSRKVRSLFESQNMFDRRYKSLTRGLKIWKPSDMVSLKKNKRSERSADDISVNSVENEIDSFMNEIRKESNFVEPKLDMDNGDYQLVFPNHDKIQVVEKKGDTELKVTFHHGEDKADSLNLNVTSAPITVREEGQNSSHVQKIPNGKTNANVWNRVFRKITRFFQGISKKIKSYIVDDLLK